jgi:rRNA-processing protein FCF1
MADYRLKCVVDANLLIDLEFGRILIDFFKLPFIFITPREIFAELQTIDTTILARLGLRKSKTMDYQDLEAIRLRAIYRKTSFNDLLTLVTAKANGAMLLTGDRYLRIAAIQEKVLTHGTLWVLDEMVRLNIISPQQAAKALRLMLDNNRRLPIDECTVRFNEWLPNS